MNQVEQVLTGTMNSLIFNYRCPFIFTSKHVLIVLYLNIHLFQDPHLEVWHVFVKLRISLQRSHHRNFSYFCLITFKLFLIETWCSCYQHTLYNTSTGRISQRSFGIVATTNRKSQWTLQMFYVSTSYQTKVLKFIIIHWFEDLESLTYSVVHSFLSESHHFSPIPDRQVRLNKIWIQFMFQATETTDCIFVPIFSKNRPPSQREMLWGNFFVRVIVLPQNFLIFFFDLELLFNPITTPIQIKSQFENLSQDALNNENPK